MAQKNLGNSLIRVVHISGVTFHFQQEPFTRYCGNGRVDLQCVQSFLFSRHVKASFPSAGQYWEEEEEEEEEEEDCRRGKWID
ncbi:hypothetical protein E2C01_002552 [Portunus trituberculatus]|uniref:Uncharacterized protein n=1 Tax=Portunus trituberculatus TaxID=210409 RepID=A0A5B7CJN0_PORTR|nr:hypothetical protein [Portunus trituberculatus]